MTNAQHSRRLANIFLHLTQTNGLSAEAAIADMSRNLNVSEEAILLAITGHIA